MYPSDLTDVQWSKLERLLKEPRGERHAGGRPRKYPLRRVVDALLYVVKTGCQWRQLPADFPPWLSVHQQFRAWRDSGVWERITKTLREQGRQAKGRNASPTVAIIDSAGIQDRVAARAVLMRLFCHFDSITTVFADGGYTGKLIDWAKDMFDYSVKIVKRNEQHLFRVLPKRWIVERSFAWRSWPRPLPKAYEPRHR